MTMIRKDRRYSVGKVYVKWLYNRFYKKFEIKGLENLPKDKPYICAPNHQNALMDALALVCAFDKQVVFLARADIFKKKFIAWILTGLRILPVYRMRDGINNLEKNDEIFNRSVQVIKHQQPLCLFPEARHNNKRFLFPLKKAIPRIAFQAEDSEDFNLDIHIVPIGIYYSNYSNFRSVQILNIGKPFPISKYKDLYYENDAQAARELVSQMSKEIKKLIIDITDIENYDTYENARNIYNKDFLNKTTEAEYKQKNKAFTQFQADQKIVNTLLDFHEKEPKKFDELKDKINEFTKIVKNKNLRNWVLRKDRFSWSGIFSKLIGLLVMLPVHILGIILFFIPYKIIDISAKKIFSDKQFHSTSKFIFTLMLFPIYMLVLGIVFSCILNPFWLGWAIIPIIPLIGIYTFEHMVFNRKVLAQIRYNLMIRKKDKQILKAQQLRKEIVKELDNLFGFTEKKQKRKNK